LILNEIFNSKVSYIKLKNPGGIPGFSRFSAKY